MELRTNSYSGVPMRQSVSGLAEEKRRRSCLHLLIVVLVGILLQVTVTETIKCSMCDSLVDGASCINHPPRATSCSYDHCISVVEYRANQIYSVKQSCSPAAFEPTCMEGKDSKTQEVVEICYWTCSEDECNRPKQKSLHHILDLLSK